MQVRWITVFLLTTGLLMGCAAPPATSLADQTHWLDSKFTYRPELVTVDAAHLFALPADLLDELRSPKLQKARTEERISFIVKTLVSNKSRPFTYAGGHTTVAAETWQQRRGDCLALTVLAYSMAKELKLAATMQEIQGTVVFDRRDDVDYRVGHVNVFIRRHESDESGISTSLNRGVVIDFEPTYGTARSGTALSDSGILARYYNNLGAEYFVQGDAHRAYAYFKAAMTTDPGFGAAASNLAGLYWNRGYAAAAESLLTYAVATTDHTEAAVRALYRMLKNQRRLEEAAHYQRLMESLQEQEPYYWIDRGVAQLQAQQYHRAVDSLERAQGLSTGFTEVHRYLAMAYVLDGQPDQAQKQLQTLALINSEDPGLAVIRHKILLARKASSNISLNTRF